MTVLAAARHEFRMQLRRRSLWIAFAVVTLVCVVVVTQVPWRQSTNAPVDVVVADWSLALGLLHPVVLGCLLADRLMRSRRWRFEEVAAATPSPPGVRLTGTYLGSTAATLLPVVLVWAAGIGVTAVRWGDPGALGWGLAAFLTVTVPGCLLIAAFSLVVPVWIPVPLYQVLFIGYYLWGNWMSPQFGIPTLSGTWLTPAGGFAASGLFGTDLIHGGQAQPADALGSIGLLLGGTVAVLVGASVWLSRAGGRWPAGRIATAAG